ncbi:hypothetical protein Tco_0399869, partial [Tanacetum coccineum]
MLQLAVVFVADVFVVATGVILELNDKSVPLDLVSHVRKSKEPLVDFRFFFDAIHRLGATKSTYIVANICYNTVLGPARDLLPDLAGPSQRNSANAIFCICMTIGNIFGFSSGSSGKRHSFYKKGLRYVDDKCRKHWPKYRQLI